MNAITQAVVIPQPIADAIEVVVQERVVAALATEKDNRLAVMAQVEGDAHQRGYTQALADLEDAWATTMRGLWAGREATPVVPLPSLPALSPGELEAIRAAGPSVGRIIQFRCPTAMEWGLPQNQQPTTAAPALTEWDLALVEQGANLPDQEPPAAEPAPEPPREPASAAEADPEPIPPAPQATSPANLYGWPQAVLDIIARQWPRYVTEREIQNEVEAVMLETVPVWKIRAQAQAQGAVRAPMPRLSKGKQVVDVTWHQAAMFARHYGMATFTGDMINLNIERTRDNRAPCLLTQRQGPTAEDIAAYGEPTL